jgi:hypothetical protein
MSFSKNDYWTAGMVVGCVIGVLAEYAITCWMAMC